MSQNTPFYRSTLRYRGVCCRYVCLSVRHKSILYRNDWTNRAGFWHGGFLPTVTHCYKEIWAPPGSKIRIYFSLELCLRLRTLKISLRQVDGSRCQQSSSSSLSTSTVELVDDTYRTVHDRVVAVYYKSVYCNPLTPSLRYVVDSLYNLFLQLTRF